MEDRSRAYSLSFIPSTFPLFYSIFSPQSWIFYRYACNRFSLELYEADTTQRSGRFLDRPGFPWKRLIVGFSLGQYLLENFLSFRQYKVLQLTKPPKALEGEVSQEVFDKSQVRVFLDELAIYANITYR